MKKVLATNLFACAVVASLLVGCSSVPKAADPNFAMTGAVSKSSASELTTSDFNRAAVSLVNMMLSDEAFNKKLTKLTNTLEDDALPTIVMQTIHCSIPGERLALHLDSMSRDARIRIRKSGLFDLKDDRATQMMVDRIKSSVDGGLESGELLNALRTHVSPHYIMTGEIMSFRDGDIYTYKLDMTLHDLSGKSGDGGIIVWEDVCQIVKQK